jgi:hypothetical protein
MDMWLGEFERECTREFEKEMTIEAQPGYHRPTTLAFMDLA